MYRISFGLVGLVLSLLLVARNFDLLPDPDAGATERRRAACEGVAIEAALASHKKDAPGAADAFARAVARRNPDILSVGVRDAAGTLVVDTGGHDAHWAGHAAGRSTATHMHADVPLRDGSAWARVEVAYRPLPYAGAWRYVGGSLFPLLAFVWVTGFVATTLYLRAVFRRVDLAQAKVVPQQVRSTLNTLAEGVLVLDRNGVIALANDAFARSVGMTPDALRGRKVSDLPWFSGTVELKPADHPWMQVLRESVPQMGRVLGLRTGEGKTLSVNSTPIFGEDGACRGALATFDDLTQVEKAKGVVEAASKAKGEFLANVSHEIRTPMNAIIGMTELVLEGKLTAEQRECLGIVGESAGSLLSVINDLLDLSKIEAGKFDLDPVDFDLRAALDDTLHTLALRAHKKGLELGSDVPREVPAVVVGDPVRLRQVLVNLIGNAIKFTATGEVFVRVRVERSDRGELRLHFTVTDTGIGVAADKLQAIFEPFTQADAGTTRRFGGTGLGLTISAHLVGLMGGEIWAESEPGYGSAFHFTAGFGVPARAAAGSAPDVSLSRNLRALVVESNPTTRRVLMAMLTELGLRPTATDGADAALAELDAADGDPFALAIVSSVLTDGDGFELAELLGRSGLPGSVVVTIPSTDLQRDIDRSRQARAATYLRKPVRRADLERVLHRLIDPTGASKVVPLPDARTVPVRSDRPAPLRILVVEDNPFNQKVSAMKLGRWGHSVRVAASGAEALEVLEGGGIDVLFTDVQMPDMDGFELTAEVRRREAATGRRLPVIAMTAHAMKGVREDCLAAGMDDYVSKPIRDEDLLAALRRAVPAAEPAASDTSRFDPQDTVEMTPPPAAFDEEAVLSRVGGNRAVLVGLIEVMYQDCKTLMAELSAAVRARDGHRVQTAAHTVKGMVSFFGAGAAVAAAVRLEHAGGQEELTGAGQAFADLARELEGLAEALAPYAPAPDDGWQVGRGEAVATES